jgi:type IV pilus assembly protein PilY1
MKTATGRAFLPIDDRYRVGFITINPGSPVVRSTSPSYDGRYLPIGKFDATQKSAWYTTLYNTGSNGSTHLREALSRVGRHYAGITTDINDGMTEDPVQYSCQQHFALLTTDGYYNDGVTDTYTTAGTQVGNQDNVPTTGLPVYVSRATGTLDGTGTTTVQTPATFIAQQICTANNNTSFPGGGSNTPCGCTGIQTRIKQRTQVGTNNQVFVNGVQTGTSTTITGTTFQDITGCTNPLIETSNTVVSETAQSVCTKNNNTSFPVSGDTQNVQTACGCSTGSPTQSALKQRVEQYCLHVVKTDGVVTSTSYLNSSCTAATVPTRSFTTPLACSLAAKSIAISPNPTVSSGVPSVTNNGGTTLSIASFSPNPQTTITGPAGGSFSSAGTADTLADVAMYYYKNDLRTTGSVTITTNNVPTSGKEVAPHQHMTTFTLGLGLQGVMDYIADYESNPAGDFANIKAGTFGACPWMGAGEQCNWPIPTQGTPTTLDDLWHAAVNGRGVYYSASDPNSLADGLSGALSALHIQTAAASASATSSPNITQTDNFIFSSTFRTVKWDGEIVAQQVDTTTGNVLAPIIWSAQAQVDSTTGPSSDSRTIYLFDESAGNKRKSFTYANLNSGVVGTIAAEQPYFSGKCSALSQCALLTGPQQTIANDGTALVNYIRGQRGNESAGIYRLRDHVLGDPINATPAFVRGSTFAFADSVTPDYNSFKAANVSRTPTLYIAANDGMLHAFNGNTGAETWAYIPRIVLPNLHKLATDNWDVQHKFSVDGSPQVMDVFDSTAPAAWKTVLVAGLNKGGRGFYAIDVTDPAAPKGMWEICSDATLCANVDADMGFSFGNPVITKRASDGRWVVVVTSGLNNASPGTGRGFLYTLDVFTGAVLSKVEAIDGGTTWGDTTTPSGFSKISGFANNFNADNTSLFIYGGDLFGNVWRFDMSIDPPVAQKLAQLTDASGNPQSITARPELGAITGNRVVFIGTGRYHGIDDLPDPSTLVPALPWAYQQTLYAFKDKGTNYGNNIRTVSPGLVQQTITDAAGIRTISANPMDWNTKDGWYVDFNPGSTSPGERVNLDPQLILGTLVVVTNVPKDSACSVGGDSFLYQFDYKSGSYVSTSAGGVIGVANTGQITVGVVVVRLPSGVIKAISTGATGTKTTSGVNIGSSGNPARRVSWRELFQ